MCVCVCVCVPVEIRKLRGIESCITELQIVWPLGHVSVSGTVTFITPVTMGGKVNKLFFVANNKKWNVCVTPVSTSRLF